MKSRIGICVLAWLAAQPVFAATISPTKADGTFISGSGIPNGDFTVTTAANGESVALRARQRDTGYSLFTLSGNRYYVPAGLASVVPPPGSPAWVFDYQFSPGTHGGPASSYLVTLTVDFDPAAGNALVPGNFETFTVPANLSGDLHNNPMGVGGQFWDTNSVPYVVANSLHLGFNFWNNAPFGHHPAFPYNPNTPGEYEIDFSVSDGTHVLASTTVFAEVTSVPAPPSIVLLGAGLVCGGFTQGYRRLRRR